MDDAGDMDGDGVHDLIVGAWSDPHANASPLGAAYVLSGATGALLRVFLGSASFDRFGATVAGIGDIDGDGFDDVAVGNPGSQFGGEL